MIILLQLKALLLPGLRKLAIRFLTEDINNDFERKCLMEKRLMCCVTLRNIRTEEMSYVIEAGKMSDGGENVRNIRLWGCWLVHASTVAVYQSVSLSVRRRVLVN